MVNQLYPRTPKLQLGQQYDPWAAWKAGGPDPYAPQAPQAQRGGYLSATPLAAPAYSGNYQGQAPPIFAKDAGTLDWNQWQMQPASAFPNGGMEDNPGGVKYTGPPEVYYSVAAGPNPATAWTPGVGTRTMDNPQQPWTPGVGTRTADNPGGGTAEGGPNPAKTGGPTTTIDVNGAKVVLPIGWSGTPGTFRFNLNGHQEDALTFLARRLTDAQKRGLNVQDPAVVYDEIARIRDDMIASGVRPEDVDTASGMAGLSKFVRGQQPGPDGRPAAPTPTPTPGTPAPTPGTPTPTPTPTPAPGGGIFPSEVEIEAARKDAAAAQAAYRTAAGYQGRDKSAYGQYREQQMGQAIQAYLTMLGAGGPGGNPVDMANQGLTQMIQNQRSGHGIGGQLRQQAEQMLGQDLSGFDDAQLLQMFGAAQSAGGFGLGPFAQFALDNAYGDAQAAAAAHGLTGQPTGILAGAGAGQDFRNLLGRYLAVH
jgi:hypothetical protein